MLVRGRCFLLLCIGVRNIQFRGSSRGQERADRSNALAPPMNSKVREEVPWPIIAFRALN